MHVPKYNNIRSQNLGKALRSRRKSAVKFVAAKHTHTPAVCGIVASAAPCMQSSTHTPRRVSRSQAGGSGAFGRTCSGCNNPIRKTWRRCPHCLLPASPGLVYTSIESLEASEDPSSTTAADCLLQSSFAWGEDCDAAAAQDADERERRRELHGQRAGGVGSAKAETQAAGAGNAHSLLAGNSTQIPAISSVPHEDRGEKDDPDPEAFDVGLLWLVHRDKMVVAGFDQQCCGRELDIRPGDILKGVDGVDCLGMKMTAEGFHEAEALLLGRRMSECSLTLMRANKEKGAEVRFAEYTAIMRRALPAPD